MIEFDRTEYEQSIRSALRVQVTLLFRYWPNGVRNVLSGKYRLFFNPGQRLCVGMPGETSSERLLLEYSIGLEGGKMAELLYAVSSYVWKRMENKGFGVEMPGVELPSGRKTSVLPPMGSKARIGFTDPSSPNVSVDVPGQLPPGQGPGPSSKQLPPGKK